MLDTTSETPTESKGGLRWPQIKYVLLGAGAMVIAGGTAAGVITWRNSLKPISNPFKPSIVASLKFPVYYPTKLPAGYHIDRGSVNEPQANVLVFTMLGPNNAKLFMSEEIRPDKYNIGGYFQALVGVNEIAVPGGTIAIGKGTGSETVASRLWNNTWVITNTKAQVPPDQLIDMLKSMTIAN